MNYTKNYEVGSIRLDSPHKHFIYELPLLSFSDTMHTIGLSLIFNSNLAGQNDFYMSNAHKLNLQKRLILQNGLPATYEDGDGSRVDLIYQNVYYYTFDDDSQRIIRQIGDNFILENPDYSTETYDSIGKILSIKDKYGNEYLTYTYNSNRLTLVTYRGNKVISISYSDSGKMSHIRYICDGSPLWMITFSYDENAKLIVTHSSGVVYRTSYNNGEFITYSADGDEYLDCCHKIKCVKTDDTMTVERFVGSKKVDRLVYDFVCCDEDGDAHILDITDFQETITRFQYENKKPAYSYEKLSTPFQYDESTNNLYYPGTITFYNNDDAYGIQKFDDGISMARDTSESDTNNGNAFVVTDEFSGIITISGWFKPVDYIPACQIRIYFGDNPTPMDYYIRDMKKDIWKYYTLTLNVENVTSIRITNNERDTRLLTNDFRVTRQNTLTNDTGGYNDNIRRMKDVIFYIDEDNNEYSMSTNNAKFYNGEEYLSSEDYPITFNDLMRYKINQAIGIHKNEIYYNNCRGIIPNASSLKVLLLSLDLYPISLQKCDLTELCIGKKQSTKNHTTLTKCNFYTENGNVRFKTETFEDDTCLKTEIYDEHLDLIESECDGIINLYTREENTGLIRSHTVKDVAGEEEITKYAVYDSDNNLQQTIDEFGKCTNYEIDPNWGTVNVTTDAEGLSVRDAYDNDGRNLLSRTFKYATATKTNTFGYEDGRISSVQNNSIKYIFGYSTDAHASYTTVSKNTADEVIETRKASDNQRFSYLYYPKNDSNQIYSISEDRDNYGRITDYDGKISYTYDLDPSYNLITNASTHLGIDNGSSKLWKSTDQVTDSTKTYMYRKDLLRRVKTSASSTVPASEEKFTYDKARRLTEDKVVFSDTHYLKDSIVYEKGASDPLADNRVKKYTSSLMKKGTLIDTEEAKAITNIFYDSLKRVYNKSTDIGGLKYNRNYTYDKTRLSQIVESYSTSMIGMQSYEYNDVGRITGYNLYTAGIATYNNSYVYDYLGQLVRENNKSLDKTFIYSYNGIGNITKVESYPYTAGDVGVNPSTVSYTYDGDKLTRYKYNNISYNSIGYPIKCGDRTFVWTDGKLTRMCDDIEDLSDSSSEDICFGYNGYGQRISKTYSYDPGDDYSGDFTIGKNTRYTYDESGRLIREHSIEYYTESASVTRELIYLYDESGVIGVAYSRDGGSYTPYYYRRNAFGDVIAIYDATGNRKAEYAYDTWGNCKLVYEATGSEIGWINPIRYRGYYYDEDTGLYYLNARYYNPEWRRFISPDSTEFIDPETPNGLNLYAYCYNDPVNYADPSGHWIETVFDLFSLGVSIVEVAINPTDPLAWAGLAGDAFDLIPFATGIGETVKGIRIVKKGIDFADNTYDTIKFMKAADLAEDFSNNGLDIARALGKTSDGFTISNRLDGIRIHHSFMGNGSIIKGTRLRVDGLDNITNTVYELKPYNRTNLRKGVKQIINYNNKLDGYYSMVIVFY